MASYTKIPFYNLRDEVQLGRVPTLIGRGEEMDRLDSMIGRRTSNNALILGVSGIGKTALVWGWMRRVSRRSEYEKYALLQFAVEHLYDLDTDEGAEARYTESLRHVPASVLFIDDLGKETLHNTALMQRISRLYKPLLQRSDVHVVCAIQPHEYAWLEREYPAFLDMFEKMTLDTQQHSEYERILAKKVPKVSSGRRVIVRDEALRDIVALATRYPALGQLPRSAIHILDESLSLCVAQRTQVLTTDVVSRVVEAKTGVPRVRAQQDEIQNVRSLETQLNARIVDQENAIAKIARTLQRSKLGLRNPNRPLGSFLLLGPSGVGKTETAKSVAELMFDNAERFTRIDMSEFQQEHMVQRLIGAPPGYVGYEEGGALTNALKRKPHSLILLDEIEKAHPKVFDIFLQVLDDGRLTSGQGETVDARNAIVMATSNAAVNDIVEAHSRGDDITSDAFIREKAIPVLTKTFRPEFINRFDAILVFSPLTVPNLMRIALLEIKKLEKRFAKHNVQFDIETEVLEEKVSHMADPRFGARPVKRFIEETCETLLMESLMGAKA